MIPAAAAAAPLLSIEHLTVRFGGRAVVDDVSLEVRAGETYALVGESGSGKSITALSVSGLVDGASTTGAIRFEGRELLQAGERERRALRGGAVAMIFQEPMTALNPLQTIGAQIGEVLWLHGRLRGAAARARAVELLARTGVAEPERRVDAWPHQLSGGQRQRAMIAMALAGGPKLLIADEPTTALDVTIQAQILELLRRLQQELGMALLFITHDLNLVRRHAHRVGVMERGKLVETGPVEAVFARPAHPYTRKLLAARPRRDLVPVPADTPVLLAARDLRVRYDLPGGWRRRHLEAVRGVTLSVQRGETLGIVGESGSGKTTLGLALLALLPLAGGELRLDAHRLDTLDRDALRPLRRRMQVVFQDPYGSLSPRMTVGRIVGEGLALHRPDLDVRAREALVRETLVEVGLGPDDGLADAYDRRPHEFSGGQRQRIAIARALVLRPELVVLDEPTSALDVSVQRQVLELLAALQRRHGLAYVFISHDLAVVRAMAHRVLVMKDGVVVEEGEAEALFAAPQADYTRALLAAAELAPADA